MYYATGALSAARWSFALSCIEPTAPELPCDGIALLEDESDCPSTGGASRCRRVR